MKTAVAGLITLLNTAQRLDFCDLYTVTLLGGTVLRYTDHDQPVPFGGNLFTVGPLLKRSRTRTNIGLAVDSMQVSISAGPGVTVNGVPLIQFIAAGGLDGARWRVERLFTANWQTTPAGALLMFAGRMGDVDMGRNEVQITVRSDLELLDAQVPKNLWAPGCANTIYDGACGLSRAALTVASTVAASPLPTKYAFKSGLAQAAAYFDLGVVTFTSGQNAGVARTIKFYSGAGSFTLIAPLPFAPAAGDAFTAYPGCDKTQAKCNGYGNLTRFRGFPYVPVPETVT